MQEEADLDAASVRGASNGRAGDVDQAESLQIVNRRHHPSESMAH